MVEQARRRAVRPLTPRELAGETVAALCFIGAAAAFIALGSPLHSFSLPLAAGLTIAYALASRTKFEVGSGYEPPTQLLFVPMLFLLPLPAVPVAVAIGHLLGELPEYLSGGRHPSRAIIAIGDSWYALGPALVLSLAAIGQPLTDQWGYLLLALAAQFAVDFVVTSLRESYELGVGPVEQLGVMGWVFAVDAALSPIGFLTVSAGQPYAWLMTLPMLLLLHVLGRERAVRLSKAVELHTAYEGTSLLLGDLIDSDDPYTGSHSRSVVLLCLGLADRLQLEPQQRQVTEYAGLLHDVGKISIPSEIVNKPGPLNDEEWEVMKGHTLEGEAMLAQIGGVMRTVAGTVRSSHERWDGRGYPDGLAGEAIPIESRIVAVCDAYNAMTTDRSYRGALTPDRASSELRRCAGTQFDPVIIDVFLSLYGSPERTSEPVAPAGHGAYSLSSRREAAPATATQG